MKHQVFSSIEAVYPNYFKEAIQEIDRMTDMLEEQRDYYKRIFTRPKEFVVDMSNECRLYSNYMFFAYAKLGEINLIKS